MSEAGQGGESARVEELLRVNAELAAELRALGAGRGQAPRQGEVPAGRRLARLESEREALGGELEQTRAALESTQEALEEVRAALEEVSAERVRLGRENAALAAEVAQLRRGWQGLLRRLRGRLLSR